MIIRTIAAAVALALGLVTTSQAATPERYAEARKLIEQKIQGGVPSISVAVFRDGRIDWEESFGWADREAMVKATPDTAYSLASISKPFTATGLMVLARRGTIDLDRPVNDYLGAGKLTARIGDARQATVRRVANHLAGLPLHFQFFYYDQPARRPSADETIRRYGNIMRVPGEHFNYSNLGYGILSDLIADQSRQSYADFMHDAVFAPLGLTHTAVDIPESLKPYAAARYANDGERLPFFDTDHAGASEVYSSAHDLIRFAAFHMKAHLAGQTPILDDATLDAMHVNAAPPGSDEDYGIGFEISSKGPYRVVSHGGGMPGVSTQMLIVPEQGVAIVVLVNTWSGEVVNEVADKIALGLLPDWKKPAEPGPAAQAAAPVAPPADMAGKWTGEIATPDGRRPMVLDLRSDGLVTIAIGSQPPAVVDGVSFKDGMLDGQVNASLGTRDAARFRYLLHIDLHRDGERLYGGTTAIGNIKDQFIVAGLTYWTDLKHAH